jgi:hypothetical protein
MAQTVCVCVCVCLGAGHDAVLSSSTRCWQCVLRDEWAQLTQGVCNCDVLQRNSRLVTRMFFHLQRTPTQGRGRLALCESYALVTRSYPLAHRCAQTERERDA